MRRAALLEMAFVHTPFRRDTLRRPRSQQENHTVAREIEKEREREEAENKQKTNSMAT